MGEWKEISSQKDIDELLSLYAGFHDSCIVSVNYRNGACVDDNGVMYFGNATQHELSVVFHSQWKNQIEMCFVGLRQLHLVGWQDKYMCDIFDAHLSFYDQLLPGTPCRVIVWADNENFDIKNIDNTIHEPSETYIIANALKWRILSK